MIHISKLSSPPLVTKNEVKKLTGIGNPRTVRGKKGNGRGRRWENISKING
jgi:hypothetical protein